MFLLFSGRHVGTNLNGQLGVSIQIYMNLGKKVSSHIFHKTNCCHPNLGKSLCIFKKFLKLGYTGDVSAVSTEFSETNYFESQKAVNTLI